MKTPMRGREGMVANRRELLAGATLATGGALVTGRAPAADAGLAAVMAPGRATVVLQDARQAIPAEVRARLAANGAQVLALEADPVRMWRGAHAALLGDRGTQLLGVTRWPQLLLVRGLAAESGRRLRYQRYDAAAG